MSASSKVFSFHYTLTDSNGATLDSSRGEGGEPLTILYGHGNLIAGLEKALEGRNTGEQFMVTLTPEEGYGLRDEALIHRIPKKHFQDADRLKAGMMAVIKTGQGQQQVRVQKVGSSVVDIDDNHPLAGMTLHFDIEITEIRDASDEEIAHGHAHGPGGHHH